MQISNIFNLKYNTLYFISSEFVKKKYYITYIHYSTLRVKS